MWFPKLFRSDPSLPSSSEHVLPDNRIGIQDDELPVLLDGETEGGHPLQPARRPVGLSGLVDRHQLAERLQPEEVGRHDGPEELVHLVDDLLSRLIHHENSPRIVQPELEPPTRTPQEPTLGDGSPRVKRVLVIISPLNTTSIIENTISGLSIRSGPGSGSLILVILPTTIITLPVVPDHHTLAVLLSIHEVSLKASVSV